MFLPEKDHAIYHECLRIPTLKSLSENPNCDSVSWIPIDQNCCQFRPVKNTVLFSSSVEFSIFILLSFLYFHIILVVLECIRVWARVFFFFVMRSTINVINYRFFSRAAPSSSHLIKKLCVMSLPFSVFQAIPLHNIEVINFKTNGVGRRATEKWTKAKFHTANDTVFAYIQFIEFAHLPPLYIFSITLNQKSSFFPTQHVSNENEIETATSWW